MSNNQTTNFMENSFELYGDYLESAFCILPLEFERRMHYPMSYHGELRDNGPLIAMLLVQYGKALEKDPETNWIPEQNRKRCGSCGTPFWDGNWPCKQCGDEGPDPDLLKEDHGPLMDHCFQCGWSDAGNYQSGCPRCHHSFVD